MQFAHTTTAVAAKAIAVAACAIITSAGAAHAVPTFASSQFVTGNQNAAQTIGTRYGVQYIESPGVFPFSASNDVTPEFTAFTSDFVETRSATLPADEIPQLLSASAQSSVTGSFGPRSLAFTGQASARAEIDPADAAEIIFNSNQGRANELLAGGAVQFTISEPADIRIRFNAAVNATSESSNRAILRFERLIPEAPFFTIIGVAGQDGSTTGVLAEDWDALAESIDFTYVGVQPGSYSLVVEGYVETREFNRDFGVDWSLQVDIIPAPGAAGLLGVAGLCAVRRRRRA